MQNSFSILTIDDDPLVHKVIQRALLEEPFELIFAQDGKDGLQQMRQTTPDIIILDVEMPGMNGYEVCEQIKQTPDLKPIPVIFLSSHGDLRHRMQGYEAGAQDFLVKPFEKPDLVAKMRVLCKLIESQKALSEHATSAEQTAHQALTSYSELGLAMQFVENSYRFRDHDELARALTSAVKQFDVECVLMLITIEGKLWYASDDAATPLEKEMLEMTEREQRFTDFGSRTIVNYQNLSLLIKNMPLDDRDRYGRLKDLVPVLLSAADVKINAMKAEEATARQSQEVLDTFGLIRSRLYFLAKTLMANQAESTHILEAMVTELNTDLLRMGLEEDQEIYLIGQLDTAIATAADRLDSRAMLHDVFSGVLDNLKEIAHKQESLHRVFVEINSIPEDQPDTSDDGIDLF